MNFSDVELERWLRAACPPIEPAPPLRRLVLAAAPSHRWKEGRRPAGRVLRMVVPFAAGVLTVLCAERLGRESLNFVSDTRVRDSVAAGVPPEAMFERIADRAPAPAPAPEVTPSPAAGTEIASLPVPRIS